MDPSTRSCERFEAKQNLRMPQDMKNRWYSSSELWTLYADNVSMFLGDASWRQIAIWRSPEQLPRPDDHYEMLDALWRCDPCDLAPLLSSYARLWTFDDGHWDHLGHCWGFSFLYWFCPWIPTVELCEAFSITPDTAHYLSRSIDVVGECEKCADPEGYWFRTRREEVTGVCWCSSCRSDYQDESDWPPPIKPAYVANTDELDTLLADFCKPPPEPSNQDEVSKPAQSFVYDEPFDPFADVEESQREPTKSGGSVLEEIFAKLGLSPSSETPRAQREDEG